MEKALEQFLLKHHPSLGKRTKVKFAPTRGVIFEAHRGQGGLKLIFTTRFNDPKFQTHLKEAIKALWEINYTSTHASKIGRQEDFS
jgi:hypothetical protein